MLNQRQFEILLEYCNHPGEYYSGRWFADHLNVSLRTIQGDMKEIRKEIEGESCLELVAKTSKGSTLIIHEADEFSAYVNTLYQEMTTVSLSYPTNRISGILLKLLMAQRAVSFSDIEDEYYISRSTLMNDLKRAEEILEKYQLVLLKGGNRIMLDGKEINKRRCIREQELVMGHIKNRQGMMFADERQIARIKNTLTEVFVKQKYHIMDTDFNNVVLFLNLMLWRIGDGFFIESGEIEDGKVPEKDRALAEEVCDKLGHRFFLQIAEAEIRYLAAYFHGIGSSRQEYAISPETDAFIMDMLEAIRQKFGFDFSDNLNLRITLALHTMSLCTRIQYDMQVKNEMYDYIRESFPLGYEIGSFYGYQLAKKYGKRVTEDEAALLAVHFYSSLMEDARKKELLKVLIFTSLKNSMSILLKQTLLRWFPAQISKIDFARVDEFSEEWLDSYDIFLTTEKGIMYEQNLAMYIQPFPEQNDYFNIRLNIDGFRSASDVRDLFDRDRFRAVKSTTKEDALHKLCEMSGRCFDLEDLEQAVFEREKIGSTFFTKGIAMAHPASPVSSDTFISVVVSDKPVVWDEDGNEVNLILLVQIGKSNPQAFKLWEYMAGIFADKTLVGHLLMKPEYDVFSSLIMAALKASLRGEVL